jgi:hypothetical protein
MNQHQRDCTAADLHRLEAIADPDKPAGSHWEPFMSELRSGESDPESGDGEGEKEEEEMHLRRESVLGGAYRRKKRNRALVLGRHVAYRQEGGDYRVGKIMAVDNAHRRLTIAPCHDPTIDRSRLAETLKRYQWRPTGLANAPFIAITKSSVLTVFDLSAHGIMPAPARKELLTKLEPNYETDDEDEDEGMMPVDMDADLFDVVQREVAGGEDLADDGDEDDNVHPPVANLEVGQHIAYTYDLVAGQEDEQ